MACTVGEIALVMEHWAPAELAEEGDNVGLLAGSYGRSIASVLISLDIDENVIEYAKTTGAGMIIAHHPFIYRPIRAVSDGALAGRLALLAIEAGVAVFAAHTNLDRVAGGVNDALCEVVGLGGAAPAKEGSIGRIGNLNCKLTLDAFARHVKDALSAPMVRVTGSKDREIAKVYVISGAGRHDIAEAAKSGADVMLTGEIGYHDAQDALGYGLCVVEAGHYYSEKPVLRQIEKHLQSEFQRLQYNVRTMVYEQSTCPFWHIS